MYTVASAGWKTANLTKYNLEPNFETWSHPFIILSGIWVIFVFCCLWIKSSMGDNFTCLLLLMWFTCIGPFWDFLPSLMDIPSVLWRCWLGGRKGTWSVKNWVVGVLVWLSVWSMVQTCIWPSWCHCHSLSLASVKSTLVFTFLAPTHLGSTGQRAVKRVCVCQSCLLDISDEMFSEKMITA